MKNRIAYTSWLLIAISTQVYAHGDEDHGPKTAAPAVQSQPFAETHSPDFELVLSLAGTQATLYLDRYTDNQPIDGAQIEMDYAGQSLTFQQVLPGEYTASASALAQQGQHSVSFTIIAGDMSDLLETTLLVPSAPADHDSSVKSKKWYGVAIGAATFLLVGGAYLFRRRSSGAKA